jgi:putative sigma-54 modulation protein
VQVNISTRHGHLSSQSQQKISDKVLKLARFHDRLTSAEVTVDLENEEHPSVEVQVTAERAGQFVARDTAEQLMAAVDAVVHKLEQQLRKHKEKRTDQKRHGGKRVAAEPEADLE